MWRVLLAAMMVACVPLLGACAAGRQVQKPLVRVEAVRLDRQSDQGVRVLVMVELENPNGVALPLTSASYRVQMAGQVFAFGDRTDRTLPAHGRQRLVLPAALATGPRNVWKETVDVSGWVRYEPPGWWRRFLTESGVPQPAIHFDYRGSLQP